ncbi:hypothetical protein Dcar01_01125 [Deinococcus carri]|uniref:Uncharacterized protein n=1 Tax=Deinococcus carri TaxID=1211323 RepID=A0ABP9W5R0_9DEIO
MNRCKNFVLLTATLTSADLAGAQSSHTGKAPARATGGMSRCAQAL